MHRRALLKSLGLAAASLLCGCASDSEDVIIEQPYVRGRISSRPAKAQRAAPGTGVQRLNLGAERDGVVIVPEGYEAGTPLPLALMLHGAGGRAEYAVRSLRKQDLAMKMIILAVDSRRDTWDLMYGELGDDVEFIDDALDFTFSRYDVDPKHVAIGGFSDGASYAVTLGIANGDLFTHVMAFSPGYMRPPQQVGRPSIFVSHGLEDQILPIDRCSRRMVPALRKAGYRVQYREFDGPHTVPEPVAREALQWFIA